MSAVRNGRSNEPFNARSERRSNEPFERTVERPFGTNVQNERSEHTFGTNLRNEPSERSFRTRTNGRTNLRGVHYVNTLFHNLSNGPAVDERARREREHAPDAEP